MTTFTEEQIRARHKERVSALVDLYGSTLAIPRDIIDRLAERNKEDWVQFVAERDGKAKSTPDTPIMPIVTDEQVAAIETIDPEHCFADERGEDCFGADENCTPEDPVYDENGLRRIDAPLGDIGADVSIATPETE